VVKFWKSVRGWGAISSAELPEGCDAFVHFSDIIGPGGPSGPGGADGSGFRELQPGAEVELTIVPCVQDSFRYRAVDVRAL
jgi:CspA family cold shock protein